ncbi:SUMF1/EgtB/PvdO family nonheme iron enzyme [Chromatium okenii]|uniref:Sulphatase-modifying factor protein n=1 Tax=Chromatium okenii TaxID=61644 RepID=A0A2S7XR29_9GAMM|nr:SUMF1/EgtB/PvdO family nonheme iron enzyme [Chromatium okenii]PQJ96187.1 Sulphatase-modifying factor protein [Chromatium okenii]
MTTPITLPNTDSDSELIALRQTLQKMRQEAEQEVLRLNQQIAERSRQTNTAVMSVTAQLAMQQEMTILNQALETKESALEHITEECRRLEDALEDQNIALDGLQQEIERKERALIQAREEMAQMRRELENRQPSNVSLRFSVLKQSPHWQRIQLLIIVVPLLVAAIWLIWWSRESFTAAWQHGQNKFSALLTAAPVIVPAPEIASVETPTEEIAPVNTPAPQQPPRTLRDRLAGGGFAPTLAMLAGGVLEMGTNRLTGEDFNPAHQVEIAPFLIGVHEVTYQDYDRFAQATGQPLPDDFGWGRGARPVVGVSWQEANAYTAWLSDKTGHSYRLPSEAEWEFAARGGATSSFWWGFAAEPGRALCFDCGTSWDNRSTAPVGSFAPNPFGLYDTAGNAMEWVADCYHPNYQGAPNNGRAWITGDCTARVARGGAFNKPAASMRVYVRARFTPLAKLNMLGFRVVRQP